jgi:hypothetical protein
MACSGQHPLQISTLVISSDEYFEDCVNRKNSQKIEELKYEISKAVSSINEHIVARVQ